MMRPMMYDSGSALGDHLGATDRAQPATAGKGFDTVIVDESQLHGSFASLRAQRQTEFPRSDGDGDAGSIAKRMSSA